MTEHEHNWERFFGGRIDDDGVIYDQVYCKICKKMDYIPIGKELNDHILVEAARIAKECGG